jgi:hypothetical protein
MTGTRVALATKTCARTEAQRNATTRWKTSEQTENREPLVTRQESLHALLKLDEVQESVLSLLMPPSTITHLHHLVRVQRPPSPCARPRRRFRLQIDRHRPLTTRSVGRWALLFPPRRRSCAGMLVSSGLGDCLGNAERLAIRCSRKCRIRMLCACPSLRLQAWSKTSSHDHLSTSPQGGSWPALQRCSYFCNFSSQDLFMIYLFSHFHP